MIECRKLVNVKTRKNEQIWNFYIFEETNSYFKHSTKLRNTTVQDNLNLNIN